MIEPCRRRPGTSPAKRTRRTRAGPGGRGRSEDAGARVVGKARGSVEHPRHAHVGDIGAVSQDGGLDAVFRKARSDAARGRGGGRRLAFPQQLARVRNRVHDFLVARAAAKVLIEPALDFLMRRRGPALEQVPGPHHDPGNAKAALRPAPTREGFGEGLPGRRADALGGHDFLAGHLGHIGHARQHGLTRKLHRAAAAGRLGGTAVLDRGDPGLVAQPAEQGPVRGPGVVFFDPVEFEAHRRGLSCGHPRPVFRLKAAICRFQPSIWA